MINGNKVFLRPLINEDKDKIYNWMEDTNLRRHIGTHYLVTPLGHEAWFNERASDTQSKTLVIVARDGMVAVGIAGVKNIDSVARTFEIYFYIGDPAQRCKGYGADAVSTLTDFYFKELNYRKAYAYVFDFNTSSYDLLLRLGYKEEATLGDHVFRDGKYHNVYIMSKMRNC